MSKNFMDYDNATSLFTKLKTALGKKAELKDTMTRADYEDAQNLTAGVYPIEGDADLTVISADMVEYGNGTVKDALDQGTGGSTVTWQQLQVTGDKIAEITVSGVKQDVFSHSIVVSRMQMSGTHIADITIDGVKNEIFAPNGGSSGGHTIENAEGTDLTQRDTLQFTGALKATDDSGNSKTVVTDDADTYTWEQWNQLTPQQRAAIPKALVTGAPGVDGGIDATLFTKLWENDSPSSSFAAQNITLNSSDYDFLLWLYYANTDNTISSTAICEKGTNANLTSYFATSSIPARTRVANFTDNTHYAIADNYTGTGSTTSNTYNIPYQVYGLKKTINLEFSAIAANVSTSADKCMLEDGITSVQDVIDTQNKNDLGDYIDIKSYNSTSNPYVFPCDGYVYIGGAYANEVSIFGSTSTGTKSFAISNPANQYSSVYVRKGMKAVCTGTVCRFLPLI